VDNVLAELAELRARAPSLQAVMFADDRLAGDRDWLADFAARYPAAIGLPFILNATPEQLDAETACLLADAGCNMVKLGVECAPGRLRREVLGRPFGADKLTAAFAHLRAVGINTMAYLMIGIPGQVEQDVWETFRFCAGLRPDAVRVSMFCPYPGTRIHMDLAAQGALGPAAPGANFLSPSVLTWPAPMALVLDQAQRLHPWLLNAHLPGVAAEAAALLTWARGLDRGAWDGSERCAELDRRETALLTELRAQSLPHYFAPFAERPDYAFLLTDRPRPLINVDLAPPASGALTPRPGRL
jgi:hypothetical protein